MPLLYYFQFRAHTSSLFQVAAVCVRALFFAVPAYLIDSHINDEWRRRKRKMNEKKKEIPEWKIGMCAGSCDEWRI